MIKDDQIAVIEDLRNCEDKENVKIKRLRILLYIKKYTPTLFKCAYRVFKWHLLLSIACCSCYSSVSLLCCAAAAASTHSGVAVAQGDRANLMSYVCRRVSSRPLCASSLGIQDSTVESLTLSGSA